MADAPRPQPLRPLLRFAVKVTGARAGHYAPTVAASFGAAALDGLAMALLVPLGDGIAQGTFKALWTRPWVAAGLSWVPAGLDPRAWSTGQTFLALLGLIFALLLLQALVSYAGALIAFHRDARYHLSMQSSLLERYLGFGKAYFDTQSSAEVATVLGYGGAVLRLMSLAETFVGSVLRAGALLSVMVGISVSMTGVLVAVVPVLYLAMNYLVKRVNTIAESIRETEVSAHQEVFEVLMSLPLVKSYGRESAAVAAYRDLVARRQALKKTRLRWAELVGPLQKLVGFTALMLLAGFAVWNSSSNSTAALSRFCAFLIVARRTLPVFESFGHIRVGLGDVRPRLDTLSALLKDDDKFFVPNGTHKMGPLEEGIELKDLHFQYADESEVLRGLSFVAPAGQMTALVGASGCGKSTVAAILLRLYDCAPGAVLMDGLDLRDIEQASLREQICLVTQDVILMHDTLRANLSYGLPAVPDDEALLSMLDRVQLGDWVRALPEGLHTILGERGLRLSGGQRQRVALARALLRAPDVLVLDEATSALDSENERAIQAELEALRAGKTTLVIAHRLATVRHAARIVVMEAGSAVQVGSHDELLADGGRYASMWRAQGGQE